MTTEYCCELMDYFINYKCDIHDSPFDCPDNIVFYNPKFDTYGIIVHDGGQSCIRVSHCPWCGKELPESKRDLWFEAMEALGIESPLEDEIPEEYKTDAWWKMREDNQKE